MQKKTKVGLVWFALTLAILLMPISQFVSWGRVTSGKKLDSQDRKEQYPLTDSTKPEPADPQQRIKRLTKARKYNQKVESIGPMLVQTAEGYHWPVNFPPIPAALSDAVIIGEVSCVEAFLSEDKKSVYSEFTVEIEEVFKNATLSPLVTGNSLVAERKGGRVRYPSGHVSWLFVVGQGIPRVHRRYVLFIKQDKESHDLTILTGYELREDKVYPIDFSPGVVRFDRYEGSNATSFLNEVRLAVADANNTDSLAAKVFASEQPEVG